MKPTQIKRIVRKWQKRCLLQDWDVKIDVGPHTDGCRACCEANPEYKEATIHIDPAKVPDHEMEGTCLHEVLHCLTWRIEHLAECWAGEDTSKFEVARDVAETVVTNLERLCLHLFHMEAS